MNNKFLKLVGVFLITTLTFVSCGDDEPVVTTVKVQSVTLSSKKIEKKEGETEKLEVTVLPKNATNKKVTWKSSNVKVATVDANGLVKALVAGEAKITVTTEDGNKTDVCVVTVNQKVKKIQNVSLNKTELTLNIGATEQLITTFLPEDATNKKVVWSSADKEIATVDENGNVTAVKNGETKIKVTTEDGGKTAECKVNVVSVSKGDKFKQGQLYYEVTSINPKEVKVTSQKGKYGYPNWEDSEKPTGDIVINENIKYQGEKYTVAEVEESAFSNCSSIKSVILPNTVKVLGKATFYDCSSLEKVTLPNSLVEIGKSVFYKCANLKTVNIPKSVEKIGNGAFRMCPKMTTFTVDNENANFSSDDKGILFNKNKTELIRFPEGSAITDYTVPNVVKSIGKGAFFGSANLKNVVVPNNVEMIGTYAFKKCKSLLTVTLSNKIKTIEYATFGECEKLKEVKMPNSLEIIGGNAFNKCGSLTAIVLPKTVKELGYMSFSYCTGLTSILSYIEKPQEVTMNNAVFNEVNKTKCVLTVPKGTKTKYEGAEQWKDFSNIEENNK